MSRYMKKFHINKKKIAVLKLNFLVLCLYVFIPNIDPKMPPIKDRKKRFFSDILLLLFFALYLSIPNIKNEEKFIIRRYKITINDIKFIKL